ncbi:MAG: SEL1-like repeat protein [Gammaproteobacteria bacterium]|nr:SEL1-like repeat protein [Gammaproteobacteria bacterium]
MHIHRFLLVTVIMCLGWAMPIHAAESPDVTDNEALHWWIERAENGTPNMQYGMGDIYATGNSGLNVQRDDRQAAMWYQRAADRGYAEAQFALGLAYEEGRGVAPDMRTALSWYRKAADQGHVTAKEKILAAENTPVVNAPMVEAKTNNESSLFAFILDNQTDYLSWWQGALALSFITLAFWWVMRAPLGVSSSWDRIVFWRDEEEYARHQRVLQERQQDVTDAMLAETIAQFGNEAVAHLLAQKNPTAPEVKNEKQLERRQIPWQAHVTFLAMMMIGGLLASVLRGNFQVQFGLGPDYAQLFGSGPHIWLVLLAGGFLVGFGTRMSGGCTSGHGLNGCARLQPGSLVSTAAFFGMAVITSLLLEILK